jgi:hypothetical protein
MIAGTKKMWSMPQSFIISAKARKPVIFGMTTPV